MAIGADSSGRQHKAPLFTCKMIFGSFYLPNEQSFQKPFHENDLGSNLHFLAPFKSAIFILLLLLLLFDQQWEMQVYVSVFKFTFRSCNSQKAVP